MLDIIVVGAGFAGLYALHSLRSEGYTVKVIEAADDVGGTWYWNRYPGARCDVESLEYSYAFSSEIQELWTWSERFATQPEIHEYLRFVATHLDLYRDIQFHTRVSSAVFDNSNTSWTLTLDDNTTLQARYCIMATGCLSTARLPDIKGIDDFQGKIFHSADWPRDPIDFSSLNVGVIGTGSSGIQMIPQLAEQSQHLTVFQRTPAFSVPARNGPWPAEKVAMWKSDFRQLRAEACNTRSGVLHEYGKVSAKEMSDELRTLELERRWLKGGPNVTYAFNDVITDADSNEIVADFIRSKIASTVHNPDTARKLTPAGFPVGAKRICVDTDYFATFNRPNVTLVDLREEEMVAVRPNGIETSSRFYPLDALVLATGFDAMTGALLAIDIRTSDNVSLRDLWRDGPQTYLGLAVAGIPNLFLITGPGSPSVFSNMVLSIEHDVDWITKCLNKMRASGINRIEATHDAQTDWMSQVVAAVSKTLLAGAKSWYRGANVPGKPEVFMPYVGGVNVYQSICKSVADSGYSGFELFPAGTMNS